MKILFSLLCLASLAPLTAAAYSSGPREKNIWVCQATDYSGKFGVGRSPLRTRAQSDALFNCQTNGRPGNIGGPCMITTCSKL